MFTDKAHVCRRRFLVFALIMTLVILIITITQLRIVSSFDLGAGTDVHRYCVFGMPFNSTIEENEISSEMRRLGVVERQRLEFVREKWLLSDEYEKSPFTFGGRFRAELQLLVRSFDVNQVADQDRALQLREAIRSARAFREN